MSAAVTGNLGLENKKVGMLLFLASEVMFFTGLLGAYAVLRKTTVWPDVSTLLNFPLGFLNTAILFASSVFFQTGVVQSSSGNDRSAKLNWMAALILGGIFLGIQGFEYHTLWTVKNIYFTGGLFGACFYIMTALHGLHLLAGMFCLALFLLFVKKTSSFEALGLYWHFVGGVWLVLFAVLYLIA